MRRFRQQLPAELCEEVLVRGTSGVLSLVDEAGAPYGVPLSYLWAAGKLIFHCAAEGLKLDCLRHEARASFCVIDQDEIVPQEFTTYYRSAIVRGKISVVENAQEKIRLCTLLGDKYWPGHADAGREQTIGSLQRLCILTLVPDEITGKEARELMERRKMQ